MVVMTKNPIQKFLPNYDNTNIRSTIRSNVLATLSFANKKSLVLGIVRMEEMP